MPQSSSIKYLYSHGLFLDSVLSHLTQCYSCVHTTCLNYIDNLQHVFITSRALHFIKYIIALIILSTVLKILKIIENPLENSTLKDHFDIFYVYVHMDTHTCGCFMSLQKGDYNL